MQKGIIHLIFWLIGFQFYAQKVVEPSEMKQFNITVNYDDYTVKTQILSYAKQFEPKTDLVYMWYGSQKVIETKGGYDGKLLHGFYTSFYLNNQLREKGTIKYGLKHKNWKFWYANGILKESITWKNGVKNGEYMIFNEYGHLMAKGNFKNDKLNGAFYTYGPNGIITEKKKYKDGIEVYPKVKREKIKSSDQGKPKKVRKKSKTNVQEKEQTNV